MTKTIRLGRTITRLRKERGLNMVELAILADMDPSYISKIERYNYLPSLTKLDALRKALRVPAWDLIAMSVEE